jgi:hypothetical protein
MLAYFKHVFPCVANIVTYHSFRNLKLFPPITMPWNLLTLCYQIRGHHIAKLDPLGISSADLDDKHPPELLYSHYSFGKN